MKLLIIFFLISNSAFAIDTGDGSDGACNVAGGMDTQITSSRKLYQCKTLELDADSNHFSGSQSGAGGNALVIKVQGDIVVSAGVTIDLSGADGIEGSGSSVINGGGSGAGGFKGGDAPGLGLDGLMGSGPGAGSAGLYINPITTTSQGGGGGGGSYKTKSNLKGVDGDSRGGDSFPGTGGSNGPIYGSEISFETLFIGGSGGAAGGAGVDSNIPVSGSSGGGGGGAIHIISGGNIDINGWIISDGGNGGGLPTTMYAGSGGGGSGGAIWIQAAGDLTISATGKITTFGGLRGNNAIAYFGGEGGLGRIRLDDSDGAITIIGSPIISQTPYSSSFAPTAIPTVASNATAKQYTSGVSCASVALDGPNRFYNNLINLILGLSIASLAYLSLPKKSKV